MVAKTLFGLEAVLAEELAFLGAGNIKVLNRAVSFSGDKGLMYRTNYCLRTALKILVPVSEMELERADDLYDYVRGINWEMHLGVDDTLAVEVALKSDLFTHSQFVAQRIKDAVVDQFRDKHGRRPSVDLESPNLRINAYLQNKKIILSLDSSGDPLYRRGYRFRQGPAPLNEVLAAGLVKLTGWDGTAPFVDFMCGSGTIPVEAAMMAVNLPPGSLGRTFGFQKWRDYDRELFRDLAAPKNFPGKPSAVQIYASDISPSAVRLAINHARNARVSGMISFRTCHFNDLQPPPGPGVLLINPPYGERIVPNDINQLYSEIGNRLKLSYKGYNAWIFSGNPEAFKHVGLHPSKKIALYNGQLACKMHGYSLYSGSRKQSKQLLHD